MSSHPSPPADERERPPADVVSVSERARVTRLTLPGRTAIRKELLGPDADRRLRHEMAVLERLRGVPGIAQLLESPRYPRSIVMADAGTTRLGDIAKPLAVDDVIELALALARAVMGMHRRGVTHGDLHPANVVLGADGAPCVVSLGTATSVSEAQAALGHAGGPAYRAPEHTGATGRSVDQRADLYALGAVLYELATGTPPLGSGDPLQVAHEHLARVPPAPSEVNGAVPPALSEIVLHLLEKEPDRRYQTADGVVHDLERLRADPHAGTVDVGAHDVPLRLLPPSRLVGRDAEIAALRAAFEDARSGTCRGVLVTGAPGVGKTALVEELRPVVAGADGWLVAGKFDQHRRDLEFNGVHQALRAVGRLLLAEPEAELAAVRARILEAVGANAGLVTATVPEFAALLGVPPEAGDLVTAQRRAQRAAAQVFRAVASPARPLAVLIDDLQWAGPTPLGALDLLLSEDPVEGLLLVGAYRSGDEEPARPLSGPLSRWREQPGVRHLDLERLAEPSVTAMVAEMIWSDEATAAGLVSAIAPHTRGNPYATVELLNALRRDGALAMTAHGWRWDAEAVRSYLLGSDVAAFGGGRAEALPPESRHLVEVMACLGGRTDLAVLETATGEPAESVERRLGPALDEGLLTMELEGGPAVRFDHDRSHEAVLSRLDGQRRRALQLPVARRLAGEPQLFAVAAQQYLPVTDAVDDPQERRVVVELLRRAAAEAALIGDHASVESLLAAALRLVDPAQCATVLEVRRARHAALFGLGRLEEADEEYRELEAASPTALQLAEATAVQVLSLSHRTLFAEAIELGLDSLRALGTAVPAAGEFSRDLDDRFGWLYDWLEHTDPHDDLTRPQLSDATLLGVTRLIDAVLPVAYFVADPAMIAWLALEALRIWIEHGPGPTAVGAAGHAAYHAGPQRDDYAGAYRGLRRLVAVGDARGYEPGTSQARHMLAAVTCWFEPIENGAATAQRAREGLIAAGDLAYAGYTYQLAIPYLADCAASLDDFAAEVDAGLAFLRRTGNEQTGQWLDNYRWLARRLQGDATASAEMPADRYADNPLPLFYAHLCQAMAAAILDDPVALARHTAAAVPMLAVAQGSYATAVVQLLRGLALGEEARTTRGDERDDALAALDAVTRWLAERAANAPANYVHLLRLLEAERLWVVGDFRAAVLSFDAARREVARHRRPWHRALITERAGRFHLTYGLEHAGFELIAGARQEYLAWGARAKVDRLDRAYPALHPPGDRARAPGDAPVDLLGILSASKALSSETSIERLHARVVEVLGAMTGATVVHLLLWSDERQTWLVPEPGGAGVAPVEDTTHEHAVPLSVLRYTRRTGEPLVVADASGDDRFAGDPYFADVDACSVLAVPVFSRGALRAALVLENRLIRAAFSAERLDAVKLVAGQLAVSLDNAQLYAQLATSRARLVTAADEARRHIEHDLHDGAQQRLVHTIVALKLARRALTGATPDGTQLVADALDNAQAALDDIREIAHGIHPRVLGSRGLGPALEIVSDGCPIPVTLAAPIGARLSPEVEVTAYYVVSEALTNAAKHSGASAVHVTADTVDGHLRLSIDDDGIGGADPARGSGLVGLKDRVEALGGTLRVDSRAGQGTRLLAELPLADGRRSG